ncbi:MAG TPA: ATP-binding protein [Flavilitoribacter sp.]|nr:ATP-binding protein [Flavilitoribacter sp.]
MIYRAISEKIKALAAKFPVVSLTGPRQSGKTTLVRELFPDYKYINLEHPDYRLAAQQAPQELLRHGAKGIIIDEAQYAPDIFSYIQLAADERNIPGEFILTGSQHFLFIEKITQSLAGRVALFNLLPFSASELSGTPYQQKAPLDYILKGFFPRLYDKDIAPSDYFPAYIQTYVERDVRQIVNVADLDAFQTFLRLCAGRIGQLFNQTEIGKLAGVDQKTITRWLSILKTGFQVFTLPPYFQNFDKRIVKTPKLYFYDTGLACSLLSIRSTDELSLHFARGPLFENFVIAEIMKNFFNRGIRPNLYFWRDHSGNEIDLLVEEGGQLFPLEIKAGQTIKSDYFKGLRYFAQISGIPAENAGLIYAGDLNIPTAEGRVHSWDQLPQFS